jgi:hypothetical protein
MVATLCVVFSRTTNKYKVNNWFQNLLFTFNLYQSPRLSYTSYTSLYLYRYCMGDVAAILTKALSTPLAKEVAPDAAGKTVNYLPQDLAKFEEDFGATRAEFFEYLRNGFYR